MKRKKNPVLVAFGQSVRALRLKKGLSQRKLAERSGLDVTYVSGVERGLRNPSLKSIERLSVGLGCSMSVVCRCLDKITFGK